MVTYFASPFVAVLLTALSIISFLIYGHKERILPLLISVCGSGLTVWIVKNLFDTARPINAFYTENSPAFPSGHSAIAVALYGFFLYLAAQHQNHPFKKPLVILLSAIIFLIGLSRLYLGEHYLQDIVFGYLIGFFWLIISIRVMKK